MVQRLEEVLGIAVDEKPPIIQEKLEPIPLDIVTKYGIGKVKTNSPLQVRLS